MMLLVALLLLKKCLEGQEESGKKLKNVDQSVCVCVCLAQFPNFKVLHAGLFSSPSPSLGPPITLLSIDSLLFRIQKIEGRMRLCKSSSTIFLILYTYVPPYRRILRHWGKAREYSQLDPVVNLPLGFSLSLCLCPSAPLHLSLFHRPKQNGQMLRMERRTMCVVLNVPD